MKLGNLVFQKFSACESDKNNCTHDKDEVSKLLRLGKSVHKSKDILYNKSGSNQELTEKNEIQMLENTQIKNRIP